ncbi:hypothetical protein E5288_WYG008100 [Bos mutus]|uniref:Uncharacterized protein n=1 Tax=Bos mutus TaxID=72004 RepID=A0A6B0SF34_9CETA|nr:hypothetical protein [Bos mutus]
MLELGEDLTPDWSPERHSATYPIGTNMAASENLSEREGLARTSPLLAYLHIQKIQHQGSSTKSIIGLGRQLPDIKLLEHWSIHTPKTNGLSQDHPSLEKSHLICFMAKLFQDGELA